MTKPGLHDSTHDNNHTGWVHLAIAVGGTEQVNALAKRAEMAGILVSAPRTTGDGYYEAVIKDPDGNPWKSSHSKGNPHEGVDRGTLSRH